MGQYYRFGDISNSTVADRVKTLWMNLIVTLKLDEELADIQAIPSNTSLTKLQGLADKADANLAKRKSPNTGVFSKALSQAVQGEVTQSTVVTVPASQPSASSNAPWIFGGIALLAVIVSIVKK